VRNPKLQPADLAKVYEGHMKMLSNLEYTQSDAHGTNILFKKDVQDIPLQSMDKIMRYQMEHIVFPADVYVGFMRIDRHVRAREPEEEREGKRARTQRPVLKVKN